MRALIALIAFAAASPVLAQPYSTDPLSRQYDPVAAAEQANQQAITRQQDISARNQQNAADAQARADAGVRQIEATRVRPAMPQPAKPALTQGGYASIPEGRLQDSNARVRDAAKPAR